MQNGNVCMNHCLHTFTRNFCVMKWPLEILSTSESSRPENPLFQLCREWQLYFRSYWLVNFRVGKTLLFAFTMASVRVFLLVCMGKLSPWLCSLVLRLFKTKIMKPASTCIVLHGYLCWTSECADWCCSASTKQSASFGSGVVNSYWCFHCQMRRKGTQMTKSCCPFRLELEALCSVDWSQKHWFPWDGSNNHSIYLAVFK